MMTVDLRVPQGHQLSSAAKARDGGGQRGLRGAHGGARPAQRGFGLERWASAQNDGLTVEQRVGGGHVTLDLIGGAGAGAIGLGCRLRRVWLNKTSSVNQTRWQRSTQRRAAVGDEVSVAVGVVVAFASFG